MPLVSVIIPIYNTEKFLPLCINSVLNQTLTDIEVLLVNDGSTDGSGKICDEYACKDQRIQVIHTLNQGVSHARNQGLETAKGEYIAFMDSDDWIETNMIATLYQLIRTNEAGLATCGYIIENEDGRPIYHINEVKSGKLTQWEAIHSLFNDRYYKYKGNLWDKLYHKKIIDKHHLKFNEHIYYNEDRLFYFSIPEPLPISRIHHFPLLSLCHKKIKRHEPVAKKLHPQTVHFHGCIRPDDFTFGHIPHLYSTCFVGRLHKKFVLVLYPTLTGNPLQ